MKRFNIKLIFSALVTVFALIVAGPISVYAATSPTLGAVGSYSVLGHTTVTNTGPTTMPGDLGISIGGAPTGFPPGTVGPTGTIRNAADSLAAQNANTAAFGYIDQGCDTTFPSGLKDLSGENLVPGVYCADDFSLTGTLTLNGSTGDVWIFKSASALTTSGEASVVGGDPCNVWWRVVSSATIGTSTVFTGNILALTSISMATSASLNGRALAQTGAVTLDTNTITGSTCLATPTFTSTGVTPKLPNTGAEPEQNTTSLWAIGISSGIIIVLLSFIIVQRKRVI